MQAERFSGAFVMPAIYREPLCPLKVMLLLCAGHGTRLKGKSTISNYGSQGKSQAQPGQTHLEK